MKSCTMMVQLLTFGAILLGVANSVSAQSRTPTEHTVEVISDLDAFRMYFAPRNLRIEPGDTVRWVNREAIDHNVMTYPDGFPADANGFESPYLTQAEETWSQTFEHPGLYEYHCLPHLIMGMHGSVQVGDPTDQNDFHVPSSDEVRAYRDKLLEYFDQDDIDALQRADRTDLRPQP